MTRSKIHLQLVRILNAPLLAWVSLGFLTSYLLFFIYPIFFSAQVMNFFRYVQTVNPIGLDLRLMLSYSESWFIVKQTPYIGSNLYPPLASILFTPLLFTDFSWAYRIVTLVSVFCYTIMTFVMPLRTGREGKATPLLILIFITGLLSYGFQFELERGQFNVIAIFLCFLAIWIHHYHSRYRIAAYILFTLSVQLKIFPFIFIVMLINDWHDWKNNLKRISILTLVNFALFFILGPQIFINFLDAIKEQAVNPYIWVGNHSISSFVAILFGLAAAQGRGWPDQYAGWAQIALLAFIVVCHFSVLLQTYRQNQKGLNPHLLIACTIGALLIPSVSHDYKLAILAAPVACLFAEDGFSDRAKNPRQKIIFSELMFIFSVAYSSTLVSFTNKPPLLQNNFPALFVMLLVTTILSLLFKPRVEWENRPIGQMAENIRSTGNKEQ
jgi:hypothetical protein